MAAAAVSTSPAPSTTRLRVLVIEDERDLVDVLKYNLDREGYDTIIAHDGLEGLRKAQTLLPDLILLDITMPEMDGYQICKFIKQNRETRRVPVVMLSGKDGFFDKLRGRFAGSDGYITKPFQTEDLLQVASRYCRPAAPAAAVNGQAH